MHRRFRWDGKTGYFQYLTKYIAEKKTRSYRTVGRRSLVLYILHGVQTYV